MSVELPVAVLVAVVVGIVAIGGGVLSALHAASVRLEVLRGVRSRLVEFEEERTDTRVSVEPAGYRDARACPTCGRAVERVEIPGAFPSVAAACSVPEAGVDRVRLVALRRRLDFADRLRAVGRSDLVPLTHRLPDDLLDELEADILGFERSAFERDLLTRNELPEPGRGKSRLA